MWNKYVGWGLLVVAVFCSGIFGASLLYPQQALEAPPSPVLTVSEELPALERGKPSERPTAPAGTVSPESTPEPAPVVDSAPVLSVPSLDVTVPLETLVPTNGEVTPPEFDTAYFIDGYSTPEGSTYVVFHSHPNGSGIGNKFFNQSTGESLVGTEETVVVQGVTYKVVSTKAVNKNDLPNSEIWTPTPGRLYLITCLQNPEGTPSTQNFIITAEKV